MPHGKGLFKSIFAFWRKRFHIGITLDFTCAKRVQNPGLYDDIDEFAGDNNYAFNRTVSYPGG